MHRGAPSQLTEGAGDYGGLPPTDSYTDTRFPGFLANKGSIPSTRSIFFLTR